MVRGLRDPRGSMLDVIQAVHKSTKLDIDQSAKHRPTNAKWSARQLSTSLILSLPKNIRAKASAKVNGKIIKTVTFFSRLFGFILANDVTISIDNRQ